MFSESCQKTVETLQHHNVPVRTSHPPLMMHHKFAVVDAAVTTRHHRRKIAAAHIPTKGEEAAGDSGVLMMGSLNWTWSAVVGNNENVIITNQPLMISCFVDEFEALWDVCEHQQRQRRGRTQIYKDVKDNNDASSTTVYYQALFFPDQGILKHDSRTTNFGSVNNSRVPGDITKEDHVKSFFRHEIKSSAFFTPLPQYAEPQEEITDPLHYSENLKISTSLVRMIEVLDSALVSLAVCLHTLTMRELINAVIRAHIRGVKVRVLLDSGMCRDSCQKTVDTLRQHSIPVRPSYSAFMMHHKFAIIDAPILTQTGDSTGNALDDEQNHIPSERLLDLWRNFHVSKFVGFWKKVPGKYKEGDPTPPLPPSGVVMTGSYNWTWSGVVSNHEDVLITNQPTLVYYFSKEFESLWDKS